jgi:hypothetical protein
MSRLQSLVIINFTGHGEGAGPALPLEKRRKATPLRHNFINNELAFEIIIMVVV